MAKRATVNKATIRVFFPDGCRMDWETKSVGPLATNPIAFGRWLIETGETIVEGATTEGQHKSSADSAAERPQEPQP